MRTHTSLLAVALVMIIGCGGPQTPAPKAGPESAGDKGTEPGAAPAPKDTTAPGAAPTGTIKAPTADISREILGTMTTVGIDKLLNDTTGVIKPHLPPNAPALVHAMLQPAQLKSQFFRAIKAPELEKAFDGSRPIAMALADPKTYKGGRQLGPVIMALPLKDQDVLVQFLDKKAKEPHVTTPAGDHVFKLGETEYIRLRVKEGYALLSSHEKLLAGAEGVLLPLVRKPPKYMAHVHLDMAAIYARYGKDIEKLGGLLNMKLSSKDDLTGTGKMAQRWLGYLKGMQEVYISANLDNNNITFRAGATAKASGGFKDYLGKLNAGEAWGAKYIPKDSGLVFISRDTPEQSLKELDEGLQTLEKMLKKEKELAARIDSNTFKAWRSTLARSMKNITGVSAAGVWVDSGGAIGMGGASQVKDAKAVRADMMVVMKFLAKELKRFQTKVFKKELKKVLPGFKLAIKAKPNKLRVGGVKGDLFEISWKYPRFKEKRMKENLKKAKKIIKKLVGKKLVVGAVYEKDAYLMAMGKGYKKRLAAMVAIARGKKTGSGVEGTIKQYVAGRKIIMLGYSPLENLTAQTMRVLENVMKVPPRVKDMVGKIMPGPDVEVPVVGMSYLDGATLGMEAKLSTQVVGMIARGALYSMMARMAPSPQP